MKTPQRSGQGDWGESKRLGKAEVDVRDQKLVPGKAKL